MLSSGFCQGLPRGSSVPPGGLPEQDGNDDEDDDDAMHEECGFVMFCAFSVMYKKKQKNNANKETKTRFQLQTGFCKFEFPQSGSAVLRVREVEPEAPRTVR